MAMKISYLSYCLAMELLHDTIFAATCPLTMSWMFASFKQVVVIDEPYLPYNIQEVAVDRPFGI